MRTYKGRTPEQQKEYNRRRREELAKLRPLEDIPENPEDETVDIDTSGIPPIVPPTMKERILGRLAQSDKEAKEKPKVVQDKKTAEKNLQFFKQVLPLTIAGMCAMYSKNAIKDPYKPCAPTKDEVANIMLPLFNMISRYIEITGTTSQNALDIGAMILASFTMGARMFITLQEIKSIEQYRTHNTEQSKPYDIRGGSRSNSSGPGPLPVQPHTRTGTDQSYGGGNGPQSNATYGTGDDTNGPLSDRDAEAQAVAKLLRKDTLGRREMGLAPRILREGD